MSLNIEDEHVQAMVREAARVTGATQTGVVETAVEEYLRRIGSDPVVVDQERRWERIREAGRRARAAWEKLPAEDRVVVDDLYDPDTGLPW